MSKTCLNCRHVPTHPEANPCRRCIGGSGLSAWEPADQQPAASVSTDGCTDPDNCQRCKTHPDHRGDMHHAGISRSNGLVTTAAKPVATTARALAVQEGGGHYKDCAIQPIEYIHANNIPFPEGSVIKYVSRWRKKNGIQDLKKARHFIDLLIELEEKKGSKGE